MTANLQRTKALAVAPIRNGDAGMALDTPPAGLAAARSVAAIPLIVAGSATAGESRARS